MRIPVDERRAALAEAALAVIARDGVAAATTRAIVAEAGMPLASFHYAYASRSELLREVVALVVAGEREAAAPFLALDGGPDADLERLLRLGLGAYFALLQSNPGREQGMLELTQVALRDPGLDGVAAAQYAEYRDTLATVLQSAVERSGMRWTLPLATLARLVVALLDGLTLAWLVDRDDAALDPQLDLVAATLARHAERTTG